MINLMSVAHEVRDYLLMEDAIKGCTIYGSLSTNSYDEYSDIDLEVDVSGTDNSLFIQRIPEILGTHYRIIFSDYAPSLAPHDYVVSVAISDKNPFLIVDIKCTATPHYKTLSKNDLRLIIDPYQHTLKLFVANLKHYLRHEDCHKDILKMYRRIVTTKDVSLNETVMLNHTFNWLSEQATDHYISYLKHLKPYLKLIEKDC